MRNSALASGGLALGLSGTGSAAAEGGNDQAQVDGGAGLDDYGGKALIHGSAFNPAARFSFVSGVINWTPNYGDVRDSIFSDYNTYQIRWLNTGEVVPFWVAQDANVGKYDSDLGFIPGVNGNDNNKPQVYQMNKQYTPFGDNPNLITVQFSPVGQNLEDSILASDNWWRRGSNASNGGSGDATAGNSTGSSSQ